MGHPHKQRKKRSRRSKQKPRVAVGMNYYSRPFELFHEELRSQGYESRTPHPIRKSFWQLVPESVHEALHAQELLNAYGTAVEDRLRVILKKHTVAYWLHLYRRISPFGLSGENRSEATFQITRATLDAAIQKHGSLEKLGDIGDSTALGVDRILGGILRADDFEAERQLVTENSYLVIAEFDVTCLIELYDAEKLAYEIWRVGAHLRSTGKGQRLHVGDAEKGFVGVADAELDPLLESHDRRTASFSSSVGIPGAAPHAYSTVLLPIYNVQGRTVGEDGLRQVWEMTTGMTHTPFPPNFLWGPFEIAMFYSNHLPFSDAFERRHGVSLTTVISTVIALLVAEITLWNGDVSAFYQAWMRGYSRPMNVERLNAIVQEALPLVSELLGLTEEDVASINVEKGIRFWDLDAARQTGIDLIYSGPHAIVVPLDEEWVLLDYAWIIKRLKDLFVGVKLERQHFKGPILEEDIAVDDAPLPRTELSARDGSSRQIDGSFACGDWLVVVEARAVGRSIGIKRGQFEAIEFRNTKLDKALSDIDEKAKWLRENRIGKNYDVTRFKGLTPIAVTPFVEFIHSTSAHYWLDHETPRVLAPSELRKLLDSKYFDLKRFNTVEFN